MANAHKIFNLTIAATNNVLQLPPNVFSISIRAPSSNTATNYFSIDESPANSTYSSRLKAGEAIAFDLSNSIQILAQNEQLSADKFFRYISYIGTANDVFIVDCLQWV